MAEKAAIDFMKVNRKEKLNWDLSVICPVYIFGPVFNYYEKIEEITSISIVNEIYQRLITGKNSEKPFKERSGAQNFVDVRVKIYKKLYVLKVLMSHTSGSNTNN